MRRKDFFSTTLMAAIGQTADIQHKKTHTFSLFRSLTCATRSYYLLNLGYHWGLFIELVMPFRTMSNFWLYVKLFRFLLSRIRSSFEFLDRIPKLSTYQPGWNGSHPLSFRGQICYIIKYIYQHKEQGD